MTFPIFIDLRERIRRVPFFYFHCRDVVPMRKVNCITFEKSAAPTLSARWWNLNIWLYTQTFRHNSVNGKHKLHIIPFPSLFSPCVCAPTFSTLAYFVRIDWNVKSEFGFEMKMNKYVHTLLHKRHVLGRSWIDPIIRTTIIAFIWWYFLIETSHFRFWCYISKADV